MTSKSFLEWHLKKKSAEFNLQCHNPEVENGPISLRGKKKNKKKTGHGWNLDHSRLGEKRKGCFAFLPLCCLLLSLVILYLSYLIMQGHIISPANEYTVEKLPKCKWTGRMWSYWNWRSSSSPSPCLWMEKLWLFCINSMSTHSNFFLSHCSNTIWKR